MAQQDMPHLVPFKAEQPKPLGTHVNYFEGVTAISRLWAPGDPEKCSLCPTCAVGPLGMCLIQVIGFVPERGAPLFRFPAPPSNGVAEVGG